MPAIAILSALDECYTRLSGAYITARRRLRLLVR